MKYYSKFLELKGEIDKKLEEARIKQGKTKRPLTWEKLGEKKAIDYFKKNKDVIMNSILDWCINQMKINIHYIERNGHMREKVIYNLWLRTKDSDKIFTQSEEVINSFISKLNNLIRRELILSTPEFCDFSVNLINYKLTNNIFEGKLIVSMILKEE